MLTPSLNLRENEYALLIALDPDGASDRYQKIVDRLKPFGFQAIEELGSCVLVSVVTKNLSDLAQILLEIFTKRDISFVIGNSDTGLIIRSILHRAENDDEIQSLTGFWRTSWLR